MEWRLPDNEKRKYLAAERLGLLPRLQESGWPGLTAKESGRIGAAVRRQKSPQEQENISPDVHELC